jgi:hypothetical protein
MAASITWRGNDRLKLRAGAAAAGFAFATIGFAYADPKTVPAALPADPAESQVTKQTAPLKGTIGSLVVVKVTDLELRGLEADAFGDHAEIAQGD